MDRNAVTGLILVALILIVFSWFNQPDAEGEKDEAVKADSVKKVEVVTDTAAVANDSVGKIAEAPELVLGMDTLTVEAQDSIRALFVQYEKVERYGAFHSAAEGEERQIEIGNDKVRLTISTRGAQIKRITLPEFRSYQDYVDGKSIEEAPLVIADSTHHNFLRFNMLRDKPVIVDGADLFFEVVEHNDDFARLRLKADGADKYMDVVYSLGKREYEVKYKVEFHNMGGVIRPNELEYVWGMNSPNIEKSLSAQQQISGVFYKFSGDSRDYLNEMADDVIDVEARPEWVAFKQNYFSVVMINDGNKLQKGGKFGHELYERDNYVKRFSANFTDVAIENTDTDSLTLTWYFGPNEYEHLAAFDNGMERIVNYGSSLIGWVNRNFFQPVFNGLAELGLNFGLVILLLTIIVRIIITPLVFRNYKSSAKMKVLKPEVEAISAKYPDKADAMKKQQEVMAMYRSTGVNPLAGCVPMLIQMPILFAMFRFIPSVFEIRQKSFLWAEDLSAFDSVANLGFEIPFYGEHVSLFTLLMAGSTLAYTRVNSSQMTPQAGMPNMKFMLYLFPVMMIFFFNGYAAGLSYYYLLGNLMSMAIMMVIKKYFIDEAKIRATLDENKKKPKKKSRFQERIEQMQKTQQQRMQQRGKGPRK
jgi:YidC/Oxa1 family membrane protein insertase